MKTWYIGIFCTLLLLSSASFSSEENISFKEQVRTFIEETLGEEISIKIFGEREISLPVIPKINNDAKSTEVYKKTKEITKGPSSEQKKKLDYHFLVELFKVTKLREAKDEELSIWYNTLSQGSSREGIYRAMVLDQEYYQAESRQNTVSKKGLDFALYFLTTYINQHIERKAVSKANFFSMKREIAERALTLIDLLKKDRDDLARWYAVLSGYIAKKYPTVWKNQLRKDSSKKIHYEWAKKVPVEHIQSETFIKLHKTMNYLSK